MRKMRRASTCTPAYIKLFVALLFVTGLILLPASTSGSLVAAQKTPETTTGGQTEPEPEAPDAPEIEAEAWALLDADSGIFLGGKNPDKQLPTASTSKVMSALVALEEEPDLQREVTVSEEAEEFVGLTYSNIGLISGEQLSVRELLISALVPSGTEAVYALAETFGDGSVDNFVEKMNEKASSMNLENTEFSSPAGLDSQDNYSSARDLAKITRAAMEYPEFNEIVGMAEPTVSTQTREIQLVTTNELLYNYPAATGVKTGTSPEAGPSLISSAEEGGESYIAVILDAREDEYRFTAAETLLAYGFEDYERQPLVEKKRGAGKTGSPVPPGRVRVPSRRRRGRRPRRTGACGGAKDERQRSSPERRSRPGAWHGGDDRKRTDRRPEPAGGAERLRRSLLLDQKLVQDPEPLRVAGPAPASVYVNCLLQICQLSTVFSYYPHHVVDNLMFSPKTHRMLFPGN